jgi:hypothetical protein
MNLKLPDALRRLFARPPADPQEREAEIEREAAEAQSRLAAGGLDARNRPGRST